MSKTLNLRIHSVKCVDETGGSFAEKFGDDEIYLGGFTIDAKAKTTKLSPFCVNSGFDDGEIQKYNPPKVFASYQLDSNFTVPVKCYAGFLLIEKDSGGMTSAVQKLYDKVTNEIKKKQTSLERGAVAAVATAVAAIPVSLIWTAIKPTVYNYVVNTISGWFGDDIFPLQEASTTILSPNHTWNGQKTSPISVVEFRGHDGIYQLMYDWELK